jgi:hypothetical protein
MVMPTFSMAKPADLAKASGVLVYLVPNRGNISLEANSALIRDFLNHGHVVLASGWQGDLQPREGLETISVPIARNPDSSPITGPALARFADMPPNTNTLPIVRGRLAQGNAAGAFSSPWKSREAPSSRARRLSARNRNSER